MKRLILVLGVLVLTLSCTTNQMRYQSVVYAYAAGEKPEDLIPPDERLGGVQFTDEPIGNVLAAISAIFDVQLEISEELLTKRVSLDLAKCDCAAVMSALVPSDKFALIRVGTHFAILPRGIDRKRILTKHRAPEAD